MIDSIDAQVVYPHPYVQHASFGILNDNCVTDSISSDSDPLSIMMLWRHGMVGGYKVPENPLLSSLLSLL